MLNVMLFLPLVRSTRTVCVAQQVALPATVTVIELAPEAVMTTVRVGSLLGST